MPNSGNGNKPFVFVGLIAKLTNFPLSKCTATGTLVNIGFPLITMSTLPLKAVLLPCNTIVAGSFGRTEPDAFVNLSIARVPFCLPLKVIATSCHLKSFNCPLPTAKLQFPLITDPVGGAPGVDGFTCCDRPGGRTSCCPVYPFTLKLELGVCADADCKATVVTASTIGIASTAVDGSWMTALAICVLKNPAVLDF